MLTLALCNPSFSQFKEVGITLFGAPLWFSALVLYTVNLQHLSVFPLSLDFWEIEPKKQQLYLQVCFPTVRDEASEQANALSGTHE